MNERKLSISGGPGTYQVRLDEIDVANGIRNLTLKLGVDHDLPEATLDLCIWSIEDAELAAVPRIPDATSELLVALGWTPPGPPRVGVVRFGVWEFEAHTRPREDDHGYLAEELTGQVTFRCGCGYRIHDRNTVVLVQARTHLAEQHPDWEQIPDDVVADENSAPSGETT